MATQNSATRVRAQRRYWRKRGSPAAWWPGGLLPLLGLLLVFGYGVFGIAPQMQKNVQSEVAAQLRSSGIDVRELNASGQNVMVRAASSADSLDRVVALARSAECDTWVGRLNCPTSARVDLIAEPAADKDVTLVEAALTARRPHNFVFEKNGSSVTLRGDVPDDAERQRIVDAASKTFSEVVDQLRVSGEAATAEYENAVSQGFSLLSRFISGKASWTDGVLDASGTAHSADAAAANNIFGAAGRTLQLGQIDVQVAPDAQRCNEDFRRALTESEIRFRTGSAQIDEGNDALLQRLAQLANGCPGNLLIAGHTDNSGDEKANLLLSKARASAVRNKMTELGIPAERINATGFGESQPIADNATAQGRAQNRRIAISIEPQN